MNERMKNVVVNETLERIAIREGVMGAVQKAAPAVSNAAKPSAGYGFVTIYDDKIYKPTTPQYLYKLPFGYPRDVDVNELRRLSKSPYVRMAIQTIIDEISAVKWDIVPREKETANSASTQSHVNEVKGFFLNPNENEESFEQILRKMIEDLLALDAGVLVKVFTRSRKFAEIYAIDAGSVNRNPNIHGNMAGRAMMVSPFIDESLVSPAQGNTGKEKEADEKKKMGMYSAMLQKMTEPPAYFQYGYANAARPVPFGRREIIYMMRYPNTYSHYGLSPVHVLLDTIQMLIYGITHNLEYFTKDYVPKGLLTELGFTKDECEAFGNTLSQIMRRKDSSGATVKKQWHIPVLGGPAKFVPIQLTPAELQLITQQEWFTKIVWAVFGVTPSELGFTADSNRAVEIVQSEVFRRKTIRPILNLIEYAVNMQLVWEEFYDDVEFKFDMYDVKEDLTKHELYEKQLRNGIRTVNEIREEKGWEPVEGGDETKKQPANPFQPPFQKISGRYEEEEENRDEYDRNVREKSEAEKTWERIMSMPELPTLPETERIMDNLPDVTPEDLEKALMKVIRYNEDRVIDIISRSIPRANTLEQIRHVKTVMEEKGKNVDAAEKAFGKDTVKRIMALLGFDSIAGMMSSVIMREYSKGMLKTEKELGKVTQPIDFVPDKNAVEFIRKYALDNVKDLTDDTAKSLRKELERGIMENDGVKKMAERVKKVFNVTEARASAIVRTETNRAMNYGHLQVYRNNGIRGKKRWSSVLDSRTSAFCRRMDGKEADIEDNFKDSTTGWEGPGPPGHPNCRSRIIFEPEGG